VTDTRARQVATIPKDEHIPTQHPERESYVVT
jgi:hypothetical protein